MRVPLSLASSFNHCYSGVTLFQFGVFRYAEVLTDNCRRNVDLLICSKISNVLRKLAVSAGVLILSFLHLIIVRDGALLCREITSINTVMDCLFFA